MSARRVGLPLGLAALLAVAVAVAVSRSPSGVVNHASSLFTMAMVLALVAAVAYLVWTLPPAVTLTAGVVLSPLAGNWKLLGVPGALSPDRLLLVAGVAVVLVRAPGARDLPTLRLRPTHAVLVLAVLYATISAALAGTLFHKTGFFRLFDSFGVVPFLVFLVTPVAFRTARSRSLLLAGMVGLGAYLALTALFETVGLRALVFPRFIVDATENTGGRAQGVFLEPVSNGTGLFYCGVAAVIALTLWRQTWTRVLAALTVVLCAAGTFFVLERSVWIGVAAAVLVSTIAIPSLRRWALPLTCAAAVIAALSILLIPGLSHNVHQRASDRQTVWDRQNLATAAENMISARPLLGFGWSTFEQKSLDYFQQSPDFPINPDLAFSRTTNGTFSVHNELLEYGATLGLVGTGLWLLGLALAGGGALAVRGSPELERWRRGLLPVLVFYLVIANAVPAALFPNLALWLWIGVVWAGYYGAREGARPARDTARLPSP
jgi:O-antigen ligase